MLNIILITSFLAILLTFYYVFIIQDRKKTLKKQIFQFILGSFSIVLVILYPFIINLPSVVNTFWGQISYLPIYIIIITLSGLSPKIILKNGRVLASGLYITKIIVILFCMPLMLMYVFRRLPLREIQYYTILFTTISLIVFILYGVAIRSRIGKYVAFFNFFTVGLLIALFILISSRSTSDLVLTVVDESIYEEMYYMDVDFQAQAIATFIDPNYEYDDTDFFPYIQIYDMELIGNELYYVVYDYSSISLSLYSIETDVTTVLMSYDIPEGLNYSSKLVMKQNTLERVGDTIYYGALDGLYTLDGTAMTLENNISIYDTLFFEGVDGLSYIACTVEENKYDIYRLDENAITFIEQIDYSSDLERYHISTSTSRLYITDIDQMELTIYGGDTFDIPQIEKNYTIELITLDHIIYGEYEINDQSKDYNYIVTADGGILKVGPLDFEYKDVIINENGLYYYGDSIRSSSNPIVYLYNDDWERQYRLKLRVLEDTIDIERDIYVMRYIEDQFYYLTLSGTSNHYKIELNELIQIESTIDFEYFDYINGFTSTIYLLILIVPATSRKRVEPKPPNKDDYEDKGMNFKAIDDNEKETTIW